MTLATFHGRIQTKLLTYVIMAVVTVGFWLIGGTAAYWLLFLVAMLVGLALEGLWALVICHQPGWLTFVLAGIEFTVIAAIAGMLGITMPLFTAALYYLTAWGLIQLFLLYILPVWKTDWADNGREVW